MVKRFDYIDALRGYAILGVLLTHASQYCGFTEQAAFGARGVQLFFVASALTLMFSWHERGDGAAAFFVRRLFRIAPMFWIAIVLFIGYATGPLQVVGAALFLQGARPDWMVAAVVPGGWSISVEIAFYCLFPLLVRTIDSLPKALFCLALVVVAASQWQLYGMDVAAVLFPWADVAERSNFVSLSLPNQFPAFAAGICCYFVITHWPKASRRASEIMVVAALIAGAWLAARDVHNISAFALVFGAVAIGLAAGGGSWLVTRPVILIGRFSFSIYLLHWLALKPSLLIVDALQLEGGLRFALLFASMVAITTACAGITYYLVEMPMVRLGNRLILWRRAPQAVAPGMAE